MKKIYFLFMALLCCFSGYSANCVSATKVGANYTTQQVTFKLTWTGCNGTTHLNKAWCFVDFQPVDAAGNGAAWQRATISGTPVVVNGTYAAGNSNGFWVTGTNGQSATVTVKLGNAPGIFNWCAIATDYPPNVIANGGVYTFHGTRPFTLIAADGTTKQSVSGATLTATALSISPKILTDATNCPGTFCPYTGSDLFIDATHACMLRTTGAKNWEAWIKDSRDNELYRIVLMPDNKWWLAQNLKYAGTGSAHAGCTKDECGRYYSCAQVGISGTHSQGICPAGWVLPLVADYQAMTTGMGSNATVAACMRPYNSSCGAVNDCYGWATKAGVYNGSLSTTIQSYYATDSNGPEEGFGIDSYEFNASCNSMSYGCNNCASCNQVANVRCLRL